MKKFFLIPAVALMALASSVSCQKSPSVSEGSVQVTFTVESPVELGTKAIADGMKAVELSYAVYNTGKTQHIASLDGATITKVGDKAWNVSLTLVKSYTYHIFFWAQTENSTYYTFDKDNGTVTVDYSGDANDENRDAFCCLFTFTVPTSGNEFAPAVPVKLTRPFAQINLCATDYDYITELDLDMTSKIKVSGVANTYDFLNGTVSGNTDVDFSLAQIPAELGETINLAGTAYVGMNYILAPENSFDANGDVVIERSQINDLEATFAYNGNNVSIVVPNVPYQRNFRTNIVGNFFTGEAQIDVIVDNAFFEDDEIVNY